MINQKITIKNAQGLHMRPASLLANSLMKYKSDVIIKFNGSDVNAKSVMNIIAACIKCGSEIEIVCDGEDEKNAMNEAVALIESGFSE